MGTFRCDREGVQMGMVEPRRWYRKSSYGDHEGETVLGRSCFSGGVPTTRFLSPLGDPPSVYLIFQSLVGGDFHHASGANQ